ncbi:uncharacterized protein LOC125760267 [Rhipicephalus sanguineus]|uniref:uncharacterized protein LOC125760267 n=1 Tax=Rhipicephalus sanguineus TaxID=34632 RepID=UPI0020C45EEB|nr:uncharacterized protein LOC125760267 [Rhipicephalus sanguineus]
MDQLRTKRGFARTTITKAISTLDALLADSTTPAGRLQEILDLIVVANSPSPGLSSPTPSSRIALPKLNIPCFAGERREWQEFWDQYRVSIHDNDWIPKIDKFKYLLTYLTGPAKAAIQALPPDLSILYRQRQKEDLLAENADAYQGAQSQQVKDLMNFIRVQIEIREQSGLEEATPSTSRRHPQRGFRPPQPPLPSAAALSAEVRSPYSRPCLLCNSPEHTIQECSERLTPEEKRRRLQVDKLCFRCAKRNHFANDCRTSRSLQCHQCAGQHLTSLCDINNVRNRSQRTGNASAPQDRASGPVTSPPTDGELVTMMTRQGMLPADARPEATTFREDEISVIIGSDIYWDVATGQTTRLSLQITTAETLFGWTIQGTLSSLAQRSRKRATSLFIAVEEATENDTALDMRIANLWCIDSLGVQDSPDSSQSDSITLELFESDVSKKGERYEVPLLLREPGLETGQSNYDLAKKQLLMQLRRFRQQPDLLVRYDDTINAYFNESHAERVPDNDTVPKPNTYYMPHHGVIRRDAVTTKLRVVFYASSPAPGQPSLNNVLMKGPKVDADLLKLLLNFRMHPIIMVADIKKAYLQISTRPEDRDALRFLCVADLPTEHEPFPPIIHWRMTRVPFSAKSSPFLLTATLNHHFRVSEERIPETVECLRQSFYADDLVVGADNLQTAQRIYWRRE